MLIRTVEPVVLVAECDFNGQLVTGNLRGLDSNVKILDRVLQQLGEATLVVILADDQIIQQQIEQYIVLYLI